MKKSSIILMSLLILSIFSICFVFAEQGNSNQQQTQNQGEANTENSGTDNQLVIATQTKNQDKVRERLKIHSELNITPEKIQNQTKVQIKLSNGRNAEIKIMPETASETALARLRLKVCNETNNCTIELKEVGKGNETMLAYELQIQRHYKLLGLFRAKAQNRIQVSAENGEIISENKPWWAFLAKQQDD